MIVRQQFDYDCAAACVAMIAGVSLSQVKSELGHDGSCKGYRFIEYAALLNRYGYHLGAFSDSDRAGRHRLIAFSWTRRIPALVIVAGKVSGRNHAVYWDGKQVLDPSGRKQDIEAYPVLEWWPIIKFEDGI